MSNETKLATIEKRKRSKIAWIIPIIALLSTIWLINKSVNEAGVDIIVNFKNANGFKAGKTAVVYKGYNLGKVKKITVGKDLTSVDAHINISKQASNFITREGTEFWIIKPKFSVSEISGLDTIISGVYIEVKPKPIKKPKPFATDEEFKKEFLDASENYFTINVASFASMKEAEQLLKKEKINKNSFVFTYGENKEWVKVMYGVYETYEESSEALYKLVSIKNNYQPIIEKIRTKQELYKKYNIVDYKKVVKAKPNNIVKEDNKILNNNTIDDKETSLVNNIDSVKIKSISKLDAKEVVNPIVVNKKLKILNTLDSEIYNRTVGYIKVDSAKVRNKPFPSEKYVVKELVKNEKVVIESCNKYKWCKLENEELYISKLVIKFDNETIESKVENKNITNVPNLIPNEVSVAKNIVKVKNDLEKINSVELGQSNTDTNLNTNEIKEIKTFGVENKQEIKTNIKDKKIIEKIEDVKVDTEIKNEDNLKEINSVEFEQTNKEQTNIVIEETTESAADIKVDTEIIAEKKSNVLEEKNKSKMLNAKISVTEDKTEEPKQIQENITKKVSAFQNKFNNSENSKLTILLSIISNSDLNWYLKRYSIDKNNYAIVEDENKLKVYSGLFDTKEEARNYLMSLHPKVNKKSKIISIGNI